MGENITESIQTETFGSEKSKLFPENIGLVVTDFLAENFDNILDYGFTAKVEEDFDKIAAGEKVWNDVLSDFYAPFHTKVEATLQEKTHTRTERVLGNDPVSGKVLIARIGRFGPLVQKGDNDDPQKQFASLAKGQLIENITMDEALKLFDLPRKVGKYQEWDITTAIGRFGPYVKYGSNFVSIGKNYSPYTITEEEACALIEAHIQKEKEKFIAEFKEEGIQILNGRFGPYIKQGKNNYKIPSGCDPKTLDVAACQEIIEKEVKKKKNK